MKNMKMRRINIGQIGTINISVPVLSLGTGKRRAVILCGMHGNEKSGLFVVHRLVKNISKLKGKIDIILAANPLAQSLGIRVSPNDFQDLNRLFPGDKNIGFSQRLAGKIFDFCRGAALVVDLHTFQDNSPIVAIFVNSGNEETKQRCLQLINVFEPDAIWKVGFKSAEESKLSGALGSALANCGIANFAVEIPEVFLATDKQLARVEEGILNVLGFLGVVFQKSGMKKSLTMAPIFRRVKVRTDEAGLFIPEKQVMKKVKKREIIGKLVSLADFKTKNIICPVSGTLLIIKHKDLVATGDALFSIGQTDHAQ